VRDHAAASAGRPVSEDDTAASGVSRRKKRFVMTTPRGSVAGFASRSEVDSVRRHKPHDRLSTKRGQARERLCSAAQEGQFAISATLAPCRR
jgi:hypothetical protein